MRRLLLDTCALVWLASGDEKLSKSARKAIKAAEILAYSSISIWEISRLVAKRMLEMPVSPLAFASMLSSRYSAKELPVNNAIALKAAQLPEIHKDPADRFIIATALLNDFTVVTGDHNFPAYGVAVIG